MSLILEEKTGSRLSLNLTPMIDFLFLMLAFFATLAITRISLFDKKLDLVQQKCDQKNIKLKTNEEIYKINLGVTQEGNYKWITEIKEHKMENLNDIQQELLYQYRRGILPQDKVKTKVLLHIDRKAPWEPIANLIFALKEIGFEAYPIYKHQK